MGPIANAITIGYNAAIIVDDLVKRYPRYKRAINDARNLGYSDENILKQLSYSDEKGYDPTLTEHERVIKRDKTQKRKAAMQAGGALATAGALAGGAYGYETRNRAIRPNAILPAQQNSPSPVTIQGTATRARPQQLPNQQRQLPYQRQQLPYSPTQAKPQQPSPPTPQAPKSPIPQTPSTKTLRYESSLNLIRSLKQENRVATIVQNGLDPQTTAMILRQVLPKNVVSAMEKAPGGLEKIASDYALYAQENQTPAVRQNQVQALQVQTQNREENSSIAQDPIQERLAHEEKVTPEETLATQIPFIHQMPEKATSEFEKTKKLESEKLKNVNYEWTNPRTNETFQAKAKTFDNLLGLSKEHGKYKIIHLPSGVNVTGESIHSREDAIQLLKDLSGIFKGSENSKDINSLSEIVDKRKLQDIINNYRIKKFEQKQEILKDKIISEEELEKFTEKKNTINQDIKNISKNTIITPIGAGEVYKEGKEGTVAKVNGKEKAFYKKDVEKPKEELLQAVQNILNIPEIERSSNIALFLYNPRDKEMYFQFHSGETYKYYDVDPDKVYRLANKMAIPITQGQNIYGAWSQEDRESLGAAFYQEIKKDPKYAKPKKGEPPNPYYEKLETLYDYWKKLRTK